MKPLRTIVGVGLLLGGTLLAGPAAATGLGSVVSVSPAPNDLGWHNVPAAGSGHLTGTGILDDCVGGVFVTQPDGFSYHGDIFLSSAPVEECGFDFEVSETRVMSGIVTGYQGGDSASAAAAVRVDLDDPTVTIDPVPLVVLSSLSGTVTDAFSGPRTVTVHFSGLFGELDAATDCNGCGVFPECNELADPPCGATRTWTLREPAPLGVWTVTATATDLAGNEARSEPFLIVAV